MTQFILPYMLNMVFSWILLGTSHIYSDNYLLSLSLSHLPLINSSRNSVFSLTDALSSTLNLLC